ncbi:MAG: hypothetical protein Q8M31_18485 [Beijerinckiaceae bacterium]|nr:hypothetical protein [Beijerinckiaceae bacterium]
MKSPSVVFRSLSITGRRVSLLPLKQFARHPSLKQAKKTWASVSMDQATKFHAKLQAVCSESFEHTLNKDFRLNRGATVAAFLSDNTQLEDAANSLSRGEFSDTRMGEVLYDIVFECWVRRPAFWTAMGPNREAYAELRRNVHLIAEGHDYLFTDVALGSLAFLAGNSDQSCGHYRKAAKRSSEGGYLDQPSWGVHTVSSQSELLTLDGPLLPSWLGKLDIVSAPSGDGPLYLVTCDEVYLAAFGAGLVESVAARSPSKRVHFHIMNPTRFTNAEMARLEGVGVKLGFSTEEFSAKDIRPVYTAIRFLRMAELLDELRCPIISFDADATLTGDLVGEVMLAGGPMGFRRFPAFPGFHPWRKASAGLVYAGNNDATRQFFNLVSMVLTSKLDPSHGRNWWVDQNALNASIDYLTRFTNVRWGNLGPAAARCINFIERKGDVLAMARSRVTGEF